MVSKQNVLAGIVTYNPSINRLNECISSVKKQVNDIYVFDNGSENIEEIEKLFDGYKDIVIYKAQENQGIATALAHIMSYAGENLYDWVLSMDQDSILQDGIINACADASAISPGVGMFTCLIKDRNFIDQKYEKQNEQIKEVQYCITSGSFLNVSAYQQTKGYDESFFIDCVDFDICYSLQEAGYKICRVNHIGILHEVGKGENRRFLWRKIVVYHHSPLRIFYLARNTKRLYYKHSMYGLLRMIKKELAILVRIVLYEKEKSKKIKMFFKGIAQK